MKLDRKSRAALRAYVRSRERISEIYTQQDTNKPTGIFGEIVKVQKQRNIQALIVFFKRVGLKKGKEIIDANIAAWRKDLDNKARAQAKAKWNQDPEYIKLQADLASMQELNKKEITKENLDQSGETISRVLAGIHNHISKLADKVEKLNTETVQ